MNQVLGETPKQLKLQKGTRFEQIFHRERRGCNCEIPIVTRKWHDALGTLVDIRLCCMAKTLEIIADRLGMERPTLYEAFDFDPRWVWDCNELHEKLDPITDEVERVPRGKPPKWLAKRMRQKQIPIVNHPSNI